jgi:hypothetical protein
VGDINNDGEIDINEFINVMCPAATTVISRISSSFSGIQDIMVSCHQSTLPENYLFSSELMVRRRLLVMSTVQLMQVSTAAEASTNLFFVYNSCLLFLPGSYTSTHQE